MYTLHNLDVLKDLRLKTYTADLNKSKVVGVLIWEGIVSHIFGTRYLILSRLQFTLFTCGM